MPFLKERSLVNVTYRGGKLRICLDGDCFYITQNP